MHALVHQFAAEALATDVQATAYAQFNHMQYFMTLLAEQAIALDTREARVASDQIQLDWENIVAAWQQATEQAALQLLHNALDGLVHFCDLRGLFLEAQTLLQRSLACFETLMAPADAGGCVATQPPLAQAQAENAPLPSEQNKRRSARYLQSSGCPCIFEIT